VVASVSVFVNAAVAIPDRDSPQYAEALVRAQLRMTTRARTHPSAFYEYVMREEVTKARIRTLPFQRLLFDFVMAHEKCVIRLPVGGSKTYTMAALTLFLLGEDPTARGAVVSATQGQAMKPLALVRDYIEQSAELHAVYPKLVKSLRDGDPWTQTAITVDRPFGIRDPSLVAVGVDGSIPGARLNWCLVDDILDISNTSTPEQREKVRRWFATTVLSRLDTRGSRLVVTNTPWVGPTSSDAGDLTYYLEAKGWPTLTINVWGDVYVANAPDFDSVEIRPANDCDGPEGRHRLVAHDDADLLKRYYAELGKGEPPEPANDSEEVVTFWPDRFPTSIVEKVREDITAREFAQNYEMRAAGEASERLEEAWIRQAQIDAQRLGFFGFTSSIEILHSALVECAGHAKDDEPFLFDQERAQPIIIATGVDLAIGKKKASARTVLFTIACLPPNNRRLILDIEGGRWSGKEIIRKVIAKHQAYGSVVRVENNAAQDFLLQWIRDEDVSVPIRAHTTGRNKADPTNGVESMFIEIQQGAWLIPCDSRGKSPPTVQSWLQDLRQYTPGEHTGDFLMAAWLADWQVKKMGANIKKTSNYNIASLHYR
jgi:hypothetical protein